MVNIVKAEHQKAKRTMRQKFIWIFPLLTCALAFLLTLGMTNAYAESVWNWWYTLLLPGMIALFCYLSVAQEKKIKYYHLMTLPAGRSKLMMGKIIYIGGVILVSNIDVTYTTVMLENFLTDIKEQAFGLAEIYHQKINWKAQQSDKKVTIAYDPMFRAVMNVIQNAVEHTKEKGIIYIDAKEHDGRLTFIVEDSGSGFTKEALLHGTEQFFMDDTSRNGESHYGIGLFFAKTVAEKYGGGIELSNSVKTGGAKVEIYYQI